MEMRLSALLDEVRACRLCAEFIPHPPRPLLAASANSRILIVGQAPGAVAHQSGIPWSDRSGDRLREWLGMVREEFYDEQCVSLLPMGFCFPGRGKTGDLPPRPECAAKWHDEILSRLDKVRMRIYVGRYPLVRYFGGEYRSVTEAVAAYESLLPARVILPHPSPRNQLWLSRNRWFEESVLPAVQNAVQQACQGS